MCFCTVENVKKVDFVLLKMDFLGILTHCAVAEGVVLVLGVVEMADPELDCID